MNEASVSQVRIAVRLALMGCGYALALPATAAELPVPCLDGSCGAGVPSFVTQGQANLSQTGNTLTVTQTSSNTTLNWKSFNVSADGTVNFQQPDASSVALNRIMQSDPSRIFGSLNANGRVYLLNQNGVMFGSGAKVNVGSMIASSLDFTPQALTEGILGAANQNAAAFRQNGATAGAIEVAEGATLTAAPGGQIFLFAPEVINRGRISTPEGQSILAAGDSVYLLAGSDPSLRGVLVEVGAGGTATNLGEILADRGNVSIAGLAVNQQGRITATTSVRANGSIHLLARDGGSARSLPSGAVLEAGHGGTLTLGEGSRTEVTIESSDAVEVDQSEQLPSQVLLDAHRVNILDGARIVAPGGEVTITASEGQRIDAGSPETLAQESAASRIYVASGAVIDVSGSDAHAAMERNSLRVELRGSQVADSPEQRNGALRGKTVFVDVRDTGTRADGTSWQGTAVADVSGDIAAIRRDVRERTSRGGTVSLMTQGDVLLAKGSTVDLSGGTLTFADGWVARSQLLGADGRLYDVATADPQREYLGVASNLTIRDQRWGTTSTYSAGGDTADRRFESGYVEGKDAGTLRLIAGNAILDGDLRADVTVGPNQRQATDGGVTGLRPWDQVPDSARLKIGNWDARTLALPDFVTSNVTIVDNLPPSSIGPATGQLPADLGVRLPTRWIGPGRIGHLDISANGSVTQLADANLALPAGGSLQIEAAHVSLLGDVVAHGGSIVATARATATESALGTLDVGVGAGAHLDTSGQWVNDHPVLNPGGATAPLWIDGGSIALTASSGGLVVGEGAVLDVSGGAHRGVDGRITGGGGGEIALTAQPGTTNGLDVPPAVPFEMHGELRGYAMNDGGTLSLRAPQVCIGDTGCSDATGTLWLRPEFFQQGGFGTYDIRATRSGLAVAPGASIQPVQYNWIPGSAVDLAPTGTTMSALGSPQLRPQLDRRATDLFLGNTAAVGAGGYSESSYAQPPILSIGAGAGVFADPGAHIGLGSNTRMEIAGTLQANGGSIDLSLPATLSGTGYLATQGIWLSEGARLDVSGKALLALDDAGLLGGDILGGGAVNIDAARGFLVMNPGASIDVSGARAAIDVRTGLTSVTRREVGSVGGSLHVTVAEGAVLNGRIEAGGGLASDYAGDFSLTVDAARRGDRFTSALRFPTGAREVFVTDDATPVLIGPGSALPEALAGRATVRTQDIAEFDSVTLGARNLVHAVVSPEGSDQPTLTDYGRIRFDDGVEVATRARLALDAPQIVAGEGGAKLASTYVQLANSDTREFGQNIPQVASATGGSLDVRADAIELAGRVAVTGVDAVHLQAGNDIRLRGVAIAGSGAVRYEGALQADSEVRLDAAQIYPTTLTDFTIAVADSVDGRIVTGGGGSNTPAILSAAGRVNLLAPTIDHGGRIIAPFGEIALGNAVQPARQVTLRPGSVLSTVADGIIPFGTTQGGFDWTYKVDFANVYGLDGTPVPEKRVAINADAIDFQDQARIDVSAGGELQAYEWVPGVGGTRDYLDAAVNPGLFAILPGRDLAQAPFDGGADYANGQLAVGDSVYLSGITGLPAGEYVLMPARYALLPGAFLVSQAAGSGDMYAGERRSALDGSAVVAGYRTIRGTSVRDSRITGFNVRPGAEARDFAQYDLTKATDFFTAQALAAAAPLPRLAADAGRVAFTAGSSLDLSGDVAAVAAKGRGAAVDVSSARLRVVSTPGEAVLGEVQLSAQQLNALGAESLLIGGRRESATAGTTLQVGAEQVEVEAGVELRAPEVLIAAQDRVHVGAAARLEASGAIARSNEENLLLQGDSALLRVSQAEQVSVQRTGAAGTRGTLDIDPTATLAARGGALTYDASLDTLALGRLEAQDASLSLGASRIAFGDASLDVDGLLLDGHALDALGLDQLVLNSRSTFDLHGDTRLTVGELVLNGAGIAAAAIGTEARLVADVIRLANPAGITGAAAAGDGSLAISARRIEVGDGRFNLSGFTTATLEATAAITAVGDGQLSAAGDLALTAERFTGSAGGDYLYTAGGQLTLGGGTANAAGVAPLGTRLAFEGSSVTSNADIEAPAGIVEFRATGADGDVRLTGGRVDVSGRSTRFDTVDVDANAGRISLAASHGDARVEAGAALDLDAVGDAAAGTLELRAPEGTVTVAGTISARGEDMEQGGRFLADAATLGNLSTLGNKLADAGFTAARALRQRGAGDLLLDGQWQVADLAVTADQGSIRVAGTLDAGGAEDARVKLAASGDISVDGTIDLAAGEGDGGRIELFSRDGGVQLNASSRIDVSAGREADARDGSVHLRLPRTMAATLLDGTTGNERLALAGSIVGAGSVTLEGYASYAGAPLNVNAVAGNPLYAEADAFASSGTALLAALGHGGDASYLITPGIELNAADAFTLGTAQGAGAWNLADWRFGAGRATAGVLTIRAGGNLQLNASLSDGFSGGAAGTTLLAEGSRSWSYRLVAGADFTSADPLAIEYGAGAAGNIGLRNGTAASKVALRTGSGRIDLAAAGDVSLGGQFAVIYTAGTQGPGVILRRPSAQGGFGNAGLPYPINGGDISIRAGRDVIGGLTNQLVTAWQWRTGADATASGPTATAWSVNHAAFEQNIGALAGGSVDVLAGRNIRDLHVSVPTIGRQVGGTTPEANRVEVIGGGDIGLFAGGDILGGSVYVGRGSAALRAEGSIGQTTSGQQLAPVLALGDGRAQLAARGDLAIETVVNPTLLPQGNRTSAPVLQNVTTSFQSFFSTYAEDSSVDLLSVAGSVQLGTTGTQALTQMFNSMPFANRDAGLTAYAPSLRVAALSGDVSVGAPVYLYPSRQGNLQLLAERNLTFAPRGPSANVVLSDVDPASLPTPDAPDGNLNALLNISSLELHAPVPVHAGADGLPVSLVARTGDITSTIDRGEVSVSLAKPARIVAGRDLIDLPNLLLQNIEAGDTTSLVAGRDLRYTLARNVDGTIISTDRGIELGGPGTLDIQVGRNVDLQASGGISTIGATQNGALPKAGASISVLAGMAGVQPDVEAFVDAYLREGTDYDKQLLEYMQLRGVTGKEAALLAFEALPLSEQLPLVEQVFFAELFESGLHAAQPDPVKNQDYTRGFAALDALLPGSNPDIDAGETNAYGGDINLFFSQIYTYAGGDINLLAPGGEINVGLASPPVAFGIDKEPSQLGLVARRTGSINAFSYGDLQVNESRAFAADGGNILIWSTRGDIDAGRGAKTALSVPPPTVTAEPSGRIQVVFSPPLQGSGIQTLATSAGVKPGTVGLFAPRGVVNAGDAGIVAGNLIIAATAVLGTDNITFDTAVGVPIDAGGLGASLSSVSAAASAASAATTAVEPEAEREAPAELAESALTWLDVFVTGFGEEQCSAQDTACLERQRRNTGAQP